MLSFKQITKLITNKKYKESIKRKFEKFQNKISDIKVKGVKELKKISLYISDCAEKVTARTSFNISIAITGLLLVSVLPAGNLSFGFRAVCGNEVGGMVYSKAEGIKALENAEKILSEVPGSRKANDVKFVIALANKDFFKSSKELENNIVAIYDNREPCFGIYADGVLVAAVKNKDEGNSVLEKYKNEYKTPDDTSVKFNKKVEILPIRARSEEQLSENEAILKLKNGGENGQPLLAVLTSSNIKEKSTIEYETEEIQDSNTYEGTKLLLSKGIPGEKEVEYSVVKQNGEEISRKSVKETVTKAPVSATMKIGTKKLPEGMEPGTTTGILKMPYYGTLTSRFGDYRSRGTPHTGIDLAGPVGSVVSAADGGTVIFAGYQGSYGNLVKIQHTNGMITYYAHLSAINVGVGQSVVQGQQVGLVGNTGQSTGPHLHFEVRVDDVPRNPYNYLRY